MALDNFNGGAGPVATHDPNWALARTADAENLSDMQIDGSGFLVNTNGFGTGRIYYIGSTEAAKSEIVVPQNAFASANVGDSVGAAVCCGAGSSGLIIQANFADMTGQVVSILKALSNESYIQDVNLTPTIDISAGPMTLSIRRTSATNCDVIVNGTLYNVNSTGLDIASGASGPRVIRNNNTATSMKIESWTDGVSGVAGPSLMGQACY